MMTIYIRWQVPQGWIYTVYNIDPHSEHTLLPVEMELVSQAVPGFADEVQGALEGRRDDIRAALSVRYPGSRIEFVEVSPR